MESKSSRRSIAVAFLVVAALVAFDQWSKAAVFEWLTPGHPALERDVHGHRRYVVAGEWLSFMTTCNPGAAFGKLDQYPGFLVAGRVLAVLFLAGLLVRMERGQPVVRCALVLVLAGAIGNVIDNLWTGCVAPGAEAGVPFGVRDFVNVWFLPLVNWDWHFPSFNVADSCISVGACLWIFSGLFGPRREERDATEPA